MSPEAPAAHTVPAMSPTISNANSSFAGTLRSALKVGRGYEASVSRSSQDQGRRGASIALILQGYQGIRRVRAR